MASSLMIFNGNCLSQHIAAIFQGSGLADTFFVGMDYGYIPTYRGTPCRYISEQEAQARILAAKQNGRRTYQVSQTWQRTDTTNFSYTAEVDRVIKFPNLQFYAMAPGKFEAEFGRGMSPSRIFDLDVRIAEACQKQAESTFDFAGFLREETKRQNLFHTTTHPGGVLTSFTFREVAARMEEVSPEDWERVEKDVAINEAINFVSDHPLSQETRDTLGLDWPKYDEYIGLLNDEHNQNWGSIREKFEHYFDIYGGDSRAQLALLRTGLALGDEAIANAATDRFLELSPGFYHAWLLRFEYVHRYGSPKDLEFLLLRAKAFFGEHRMFALVMAWIKIHSGRPADAAPHAFAWLQSAPDQADAIVPSLYIHLRQGEVDAAAELALHYVRGRNKKDLGPILNCYREIDGLRYDPTEIERAMSE